jgi:hypothetical protein
LGGGGAGGLLTNTATLSPTTTYTVTVGAGGAATAGFGNNGSNSVLSGTGLTTVTSVGGGGGGNAASNSNGSAGGSGGGGGGDSSNNGVGGAGTVGQGNTGGTASSNGGGTQFAGGGGGGASAVGVNASSFSIGGAGGAGTASSISGSSVTYAGGGGGGAYIFGSTGTNGAGGAGGGGAGGANGTNAISGTANTGGGGGGNGFNSLGSQQGVSGKGGSGIVIISYLGAQQFSGGVVTSSGGNTIHTFTTSGTLGPVTPLSANYLVVAGGGSGGAYIGGTGLGGGGGAGGLLSGSALVIDPYSTYVVTVGSGGAGTATSTGTNGSNSSFSAYATSSVGGGYGGVTTAGANGGSGGGGGGNLSVNAGGSATSGQGFAGGSSAVGAYIGGGGGGAGAVGGNGSVGVGGSGGVGISSSISGSATFYAGGGGASGGTPGIGGNGGGGSGTTSTAGTSGTANTGGGGGGSSGASGATAGGAGGSGVVIISYAGSTQLMAGGVVTIAGGNVIHTFNSSGYLTPLTLLTRSLRFRGAYPTTPSYLSRTAGTPTNNLKWTFSFWTKRGVLSVGQHLLNGGTGTSASEDYLTFLGSNKLAFYQGNAATTIIATDAVYRDPAAWMHVVLVYDSAQATSTNRLFIYVNGVSQSFSSATYPTLNQSTNINANGVLQRISSRTYAADEGFDGYMAEVNFIDGQALAPTAFGTVNSYGVWQPITYGGSYGTNGFRLPFTNNASTTTLGYDFSPQGNNWTTNNISVTAGSTYDSMTDVPTLTSATAANFAVLNAVDIGYSAVLSEANLKVSTASSGNAAVASTMAMTGNTYWEVTIGSNSQIGLIWGPASDAYGNSKLSMFANGATGSLNNATRTLSATPSWSNGDTLGFAWNNSARTLTLYQAGSATAVMTILTPTTGDPMIAITNYTSGAVMSSFLNCGQRPFTYTPPSGYLALNTYNL